MSGGALGPGGLLAVTIVLCASLARTTAAGVNVAFSPAAQQVAPGAEFDLTLEVTAAGSAFNAFDARIGFDPAALTAVPLSPIASQVGPLFTAVCPNVFHRFSAGASQDTVGCSMLCAGQSTSGPGTFYRLRFRAANTAQQTVVTFDQLRFFQAGLFVLPVTSAPASIGIGMPPATTGADAPAVAAITLRAGPSPARERVHFACAAHRAGRVRLDVLDPQGRRVRRLLDDARPPGAWTAEWDARDDSGARVPAGAYLAVFTAGDARVTRRLVVFP